MIQELSLQNKFKERMNKVYCFEKQYSYNILLKKLFLLENF